MENFPIQDLLFLEKQYTTIRKEYALLEEIFNEVLEGMDMSRYYEDQERYEYYLLKFNQLDKNIEQFKNKLDSLRNQLLN